MFRLAVLATLGFLSLFAAGASARADLKPQELAIIAARGNRESEALARYYARERGVPEENICLVDVPKDEVCARKDWTWAIRPEIRKWLDEHDPGAKLRCLVTVWGIPLKIGPADKDAAMLRYRTFLEGERNTRIKAMEEASAEFAKLASGLADESSDASPSDEAEEAKAPVAGSELDRLRAKLETNLRNAQLRISKLPVGAERLQAQQRLQQLVAVTGGVNVILQGLGQQVAAGANVDAQISNSFQTLRGVQAAWSEARVLVEQQPASIERDALVIAILERVGGQLLALPWIDEQIANIDRNETGASFDSELSLVMWPDDYQLLRWQPNYLRAGYAGSQLREVFRTLMVSRIDAPTIQLAKGLVDTAIKVEKEGLHGKAYFDARGLAKLEATNINPGSYEDYDRALLLTAKGIHDQTNLGVVVNDKPELFKPGECPDAALYCGWYSLAKYVDAFDWVPGAVAYHLASNEAQTLHDPKSKEWCKSMLADGVCATMGPVYEPYLMSFPRPEDFFALLLQGKLTLVECYYATQPFNSWMMTLIGDPLYRPFKNNPALGGAPTAVRPDSPAVVPGIEAAAPPTEAAPSDAAPPANGPPASDPAAATPPAADSSSAPTEVPSPSDAKESAPDAVKSE